uniref:Sciellin n=1 Tax=Loxodonta africana TaxID=9785 RepID=G3T4U1_LOXAF
MSNLTMRKTTPTGHDKSAAQGTMLRQQGSHEVNKKRTFLQDNSWIKKHPEEEKDENYGRVVLNRHNSHDALDRKTNEREEPKATISRYKSDDTLDRSLSAFRSPESTKQPGNLFSTNTTNTTASTSATTPVKKKRQSWFPPPPPGYNAASGPGTSRREPGFHPPILPKPSSPVSSPNLLRRDNRQICPSKPCAYTETSRYAEGNTRSQDLDNTVKVNTSSQKTDKGSEELDNLIKMNKSLNRNQGLDGLFRANPKAEQPEKRAKSLENLICVNPWTDKGGKGNQGFGSLIKVNQRDDKNEKGKQDLDGLIKTCVHYTSIHMPHISKDLDSLIKVNPRTGKSIQGGQSLDNFIKGVPEANRTNQGSQDLDNLIKVNPLANKSSEQGLDELINVSPKAVRNITGNQDLDKLIEVNPETLRNNQRNHDLDKLIKVNPAVIRSNQSQDLEKFIEVKPSALRNAKRDQDLDNLIEVNSNVSENMGRLNGQVNGSTNVLNSQSTGTIAYSYEIRNNPSSSVGSRHEGPKDTVVYTRTYVENSKSPKGVHPENTSGNYIQTVYSTSDRSVIERDMCTYCRKPLGVEAKMILDELQIRCHCTCFKCEICKQPLENLKAGDSIWIYRQTIHCKPCYSKVMAKWIQ